jgi:hypothetical protein
LRGDLLVVISVQIGYQITASVRSEAKAQEILKLHPEWTGKVKFVFVKDIITPDAFDDVFKQEENGFNYIIHTASPVNFSVTDFQKDLIDPAVQGSVAKSRRCATKLRRSVVPLGF